MNPYKVAVLSHSYLEPENRKNIAALAAATTVRTILPRFGPVLVFPYYEFESSDFSRELFQAFRAIYLSAAQYLLLTPSMGLRRFQPDIIHVEYNPWSIMFLQAHFYRRLFCPNAKLVCTVKKNTYRRYPGWRGPLKEWLSRWTLARTDHVIAASAMAARLIEGKFDLPAGRITVAHHLGVDTKLFAPGPAAKSEPSAPVIIGYCGRFDSDKGVTDLLAAVAHCREICARPVALKLLGRGRLQAHLERQSETTPWLEVLPPVPNAEVALFLRGLDIFVLPSRVLEDHQEHDAHALLEAMATGLATVGARSGIIPEILSDGSGLLVDPEKPEELAVVLADLVENDDTRRELGHRGRRKAEREFSLDVIARRKIEIFETVLHERRTEG